MKKADASIYMSEHLFYAIVAARVEEHLELALEKLRSEGEVTLTNYERESLQAWITAGRKRPRGRPSADTVMIAMECMLRERKMPLKKAVGITAERYKVSTAAVYAARRKVFPVGGRPYC
jgi:hypothetical protein